LFTLSLPHRLAAIADALPGMLIVNCLSPLSFLAASRLQTEKRMVKKKKKKSIRINHTQEARDTKTMYEQANVLQRWHPERCLRTIQLIAGTQAQKKLQGYLRMGFSKRRSHLWPQAPTHECSMTAVTNPTCRMG
jgi:ABC-type bacteriocin/lantibiotic exporter with double-glycine peptidase domain